MGRPRLMTLGEIEATYRQWGLPAPKAREMAERSFGMQREFDIAMRREWLLGRTMDRLGVPAGSIVSQDLPMEFRGMVAVTLPDGRILFSTKEFVRQKRTGYRSVAELVLHEQGHRIFNAGHSSTNPRDNATWMGASEFLLNGRISWARFLQAVRNNRWPIAGFAPF